MAPISSNTSKAQVNAGKQTKPRGPGPLRRLLPFIKPYAALYLVGIVGVALANLGFNVVFARMIIDFTCGAMEISPRAILGSVTLLAASMLVLGVLVFWAGRKLINATTMVLGDLRDAFFHKVLTMPVGETERRHSGDILSRATNDISLAGTAFSQSFQTLANTVFSGVGSAVYAVMLDPKLGLMAIAVCALPLIASSFFVPRLRAAGRVLQESKGRLVSGFSDLIQGAEVIRTFNLSDAMYQRVAGEIAQVQEAGLRQAHLEAGRSAAGGVAGLIRVLFTVYATRQAILNPAMIPLLVGIVQLMNPIGNMFSTLGTTIAGIQANLAAGERVLEILDIPAEPVIYTPPIAATPLKPTHVVTASETAADTAAADTGAGDAGTEDAGIVGADGARPGEAMPGVTKEAPAILVKDLTFRYPDNPVNTLEGVCFSVPKGKTVAVVGPSGSGKTTLFKVLLGLYPPLSGDILVDSQSIYETDLEAWRAKFSYVPQDAFLFSGTVLENVQGSEQCAGPDSGWARLTGACHRPRRRICRQAPRGLHSQVGQRGGNLSGGQRQRLAIARAVFKDAPVLLLDEATSHLDTESEKLVQAALQQLMQTRTCIVIAHRLSTDENDHQIIYLEDWRITERGTHGEAGRPDSRPDCWWTGNCHIDNIHVTREGGKHLCTYDSDLRQAKNLLVVSPHPDDAEIAAGGTIAPWLKQAPGSLTPW